MKTLLLLFFITISLFASEQELRLESNIYYTITKELTHKERPKVYMQTAIPAIEQFPSHFEIVTSCKEADILLISYKKEVNVSCQNKIIFGTRNKTLSMKHTVGAFFWQKGRPNILFYKSRIEKIGLDLGKEFQKYIDDEK